MIRHVTVHTPDPYALATFWAAALGGRLQDDDHPGDPAATVTSTGPTLLFERGEPSSGHLDLQPDLPRAQEVERLRGLGASVLSDRTHADGSGWIVMADPAGNPFCVERSAAERGELVPGLGARALPPIHTADERTMLTGMLEWYRRGVLLKVDGMSQDDAVSTPLRSGTTAAGLVQHLAYVEDSWVTHGLDQQPLPDPWSSAPFADDPDWEFSSADDLALAVLRYRQACDRSREVLGRLGLDVTAVNARGRAFSVRFVLLHLIEETARHLGHLDLLRELADGVTGE
ncbi:MAG: hypothetical protein JWO60_3311 [Frankiales bacterium]|nr:hypothetical protein [Frankiales bacterium]